VTRYFLDSSALIKRYVAEAGTKWVRSLTARSARNSILIAQITQAEIVSGIMRRRREGVITAETARAVRFLVDSHASLDYRVVKLTGQIIQRAEDLLELYMLRAADSIQLASALESNQRVMAAGLSPVIFISADTRLLEAASSEGLATGDPNARP
jgi:predicted nucleic acid-binding protein